MGKREWSAYQLAVFREIQDGRGHVVVEAVPGSGKTTTTMEGVNYVPPGKSVLIVAFNKSIATELQSRAPRGVDVSTLHSFGLRALTKKFGRLQVVTTKVSDLLRARFGDERETWELRRNVEKLISLAKGCLVSEAAGMDVLIDQFGLDFGTTEDRIRAIEGALAVMEQCKNVEDTGTIDFDDMVWLPVVLKVKPWLYDYVFVDETQDLNAAQIELALMACRKGGRIVAVGDPNQAIYAFRGADSQAIPNIIRRLKAKVMPLSVCYRCASSIVAKAKTLVPVIEPFSGAEEGEVVETDDFTMQRQAGPGDFILSRTNAPLISLCLSFLSQGRRANIQGRDIGTSLTAFVKKSQCSMTSRDGVTSFLAFVDRWRTDEITRLAAKGRDTQAVEDKAACLETLCEGVESLQYVVARIESLFSDGDDANRIILSTTHKAKGLERDRVWVLSDTYMKRAGQEEINLAYVAWTRARKQLFLVSGVGKPKARPAAGAESKMHSDAMKRFGKKVRRAE